jgi:hypothetical protein
MHETNGEWQSSLEKSRAFAALIIYWESAEGHPCFHPVFDASHATAEPDTRASQCEVPRLKLDDSRRVLRSKRASAA